MNARLLFLGSVGLLSLFAAPVPAQFKELADLAPAHTLAYLELHQPTQLARELRALVKGSYLQDPTAFIARHRKQKLKDSEALILAWLGSPEFIDELGDWQGGFVALTGLTKNDNPEITSVLFTGKSRMLPVFVRMGLAASDEVRCVGRVEGVDIFQVGEPETVKRGPAVAWGPAGPVFSRPLAYLGLVQAPLHVTSYKVALAEEAPPDDPPEKPDCGFFVAQLPGAVAAGSNPDVLADTIRRLKGRSTSPTLTKVPAFREAAASLRRPGVFLYADLPRLTRLIDDALRRELLRRQDEIKGQRGQDGKQPNAAQIAADLRAAEDQHRRESQGWRVFEALVRPQKMHSFGSGCSLQGGDLSWRVELRMQENQTSPLLDLLTNQKLSADLVRVIPGDAFSLFTLQLTDGEKSLYRLLRFLDAVSIDPEEKESTPSKVLRDLENQMKLRLGRDVLAKVKAAAVAFHLVMDEKKGLGLYPVLVVETGQEAAARGLADLLPRLFALGGKPDEPQPHQIDGQLILSLKEETVDPDLNGLPPHYGWRGKFLVLGWHRAAVAATLRAGARTKDLLNLPRGLPAVEAEGPVSALGLFSCRQLLTHWTRMGSEACEQNEGHVQALHYLRELSTPMAAMPPTMLVLKRLPEGVCCEFRQRELPVASATVIDILLTWLLDEEAGRALFSEGWWRTEAASSASLPSPLR
jgi:hypothetical protein